MTPGLFLLFPDLTSSHAFPLNCNTCCLYNNAYKAFETEDSFIHSLNKYLSDGYYILFWALDTEMSQMAMIPALMELSRKLIVFNLSWHSDCFLLECWHWKECSKQLVQSLAQIRNSFFSVFAGWPFLTKNSLCLGFSGPLFFFVPILICFPISIHHVFFSTISLPLFYMMAH